MKPLLLFALLVFCTYSLTAQSIFKPDYVEGSFQAGSILKNYPDFPEVKNLALIAGFRIGNRLHGIKDWHSFYHYPDLGLNFLVGSIGNNEKLGNFAALVPEMTFHFPLSKKWISSVSAGLGVSYFNKPFNKITNTENIVIGSHITFCALAGFNFEYELKEDVSIIFKTAVYHSSNSHTSLPNVGMNLPALGVGVKYFPRGTPGIIKRDSAANFESKVHFNVRLGMGHNEQGGSTAPTNGPAYPIYLVSMFASKNISPINKLQLGVEGWYNTGVYDYIISQNFYDDNQTWSAMAIVVYAGHEFLIGHLSLVTQGGVYLHNPFYSDRVKGKSDVSLKEKLKTIFPARLGLQYYYFNAIEKHRHNFFAGIYIKTNLGQADFLDTGIGYTF